MSFIIFTDGGNRNTGNVKGGHVNKQDKSAWAYLIINKNHGISEYGSKGYFGKTNNEMEVTALYESLKFIDNSESNLLKEEPINIFLDSTYVLNSLEKGWAKNWIVKNDVKRPNFHVWEKLIPLYEKYSNNIKLNWVKGHENNKGNIFVDKLLNKTMDEL